MSDHERERIDELRQAALSGRMSRRAVLQRALALGLSAPVIATLLAACGGDDDDDDGGAETATEEAAGGEETATEAESAATEAESTEVETEAGATEADGTATEDKASATDTEATASGSGESGEWITNEVDPLTMGEEWEEPASEGGILIEGGTSDIRTTNPLLVNDTPSGYFLALIFEALFDADPDTLKPVGRLAEQWQISEDNLTWTIRLREGVSWQDGEPLTAEDVKVTYELHANPETTSSRTSEVNDKIESVTAIDDQTVEFKLTKVNPDFAADVGALMIVPAHIWKDVPPAEIPQHDGSTGADPSAVVGTGPYKFEEWVVEDRASAVPNPDFWGGAPVIERFIYKVLGEQSVITQQLKTAEVDFGTITESSVPEFEGTDVGVFEFDTLNTTFYATNMDPEKTTLFQDAAVRKALFLALDRQAMIDSIRFGYGQAAVGTIPTLSWAYNPDGIEEELRYEYDPEQASSLLDEAGWVVGDDGVRAKEGQRLAFTAHTAGGFQVYEGYLTVMQEAWRQIGVEMMPHLEPFPALVERITKTFDFEVMMIGFSWGISPDQSNMWACDAYPSGFNMVKYCNPDVDDLLAQALSEPDIEKRIELYTEFQNTLLPDLPMAVVDFPQKIIAVNNRIHNMDPNDVNYRYNAHLWWIE